MNEKILTNNLLKKIMYEEYTKKLNHYSNLTLKEVVSLDEDALTSNQKDNTNGDLVKNKNNNEKDLPLTAEKPTTKKDNEKIQLDKDTMEAIANMVADKLKAQTPETKPAVKTPSQPAKPEVKPAQVPAVEKTPPKAVGTTSSTPEKPKVSAQTPETKPVVKTPQKPAVKTPSQPAKPEVKPPVEKTPPKTSSASEKNEAELENEKKRHKNKKKKKDFTASPKIKTVTKIPGEGNKLVIAPGTSIRNKKEREQWDVKNISLSHAELQKVISPEGDVVKKIVTNKELEKKYEIT